METFARSVEPHILTSQIYWAGVLLRSVSRVWNTQDLINRGWTYDSELGWVLSDSVRSDGIDGSSTFYHYEWTTGPRTGCRKLVNAAGRRSRIHTYGDSFTHCDQVSDAETWQEYLAAHLQEPVENYGVVRITAQSRTYLAITLRALPAA